MSVFRRIHSEILVENEWHRYRRDRYLLRNGEEGEYYYIDMAGSCGIIPLFEDGSTLLLRVERYLLGRFLYEFPIGGMCPGEAPLEVARKELREEAGLLADDWTALGSFAPYKGASNEICHFFLARGLEERGQELESCENIKALRMPLAHARCLLLEQELPDGQSLAGLMLLDRWQARGGRL
ncbi:MAG TPA: NUDIX hydrolase [Planctomycetes bacterium]|nr:NUDIX hydrolase [Planctomycetota bacterium]